MEIINTENSVGNNVVVVSCGPIPAKLDSVKYVTNRFKGGLSFKTAKYLIDNDYNVLIIKWKHTPLPDYLSLYPHVVDVEDVHEYYNWFKHHAHIYKYYILSAAICNLCPSNPYEDKFPSHLYKVGEKFTMEWEIAPRAIDLIKEINPRACLIGYKMFDKLGLIEAAKHTLEQSKANVIFANTIEDAKNQKFALTQDGAIIHRTFDEHLKFIEKTLNAQFFETDVSSYNYLPYLHTEREKDFVNKFEQTFITDHGSVAVPLIRDNKFHGIVTTSRGHKEKAVHVQSIDIKTRKIIADGKATLNAPLLYKICEDLYQKEHTNFYIEHNHDFPKHNAINFDYEFPGTLQEVFSVLKKYSYANHIEFHGDINIYQFKEIDWKSYATDFSKYIDNYEQFKDYGIDVDDLKNQNSLEIGCGQSTVCAKSYDSNCLKTYADLVDFTIKKFDIIICKNAINYLSIEEIEFWKNRLTKGGRFICNSFRGQLTSSKEGLNEIAIPNGNIINHYLLKGEDDIVKHSFNNYGFEHFEALGFKQTPYGQNSVMYEYINEE